MRWLSDWVKAQTPKYDNLGRFQSLHAGREELALAKLYTHTHKHTHSYRHTETHTYTHTYTWTHTQIYRDIHTQTHFK